MEKREVRFQAFLRENLDKRKFSSAWAREAVARRSACLRAGMAAILKNQVSMRN